MVSRKLVFVIIICAVAVKQVVAANLSCPIDEARIIGRIDADGNFKAAEVSGHGRQLQISKEENWIKFPSKSHRVGEVFNEAPNGENQAQGYGCTCGVLDTCVPKCCPPGQVVKMLSDGICEDRDLSLVESHLTVYESKDGDELAHQDSSPGKVILYHKMLKCSADGAKVLNSHKLLKFGSLHGVSESIDNADRANRIFESSEYCIDFRLDEGKPSAFACRVTSAWKKFYPYLYSLNSLFFFLTFVVYMMLPKLRRSKGYLLLNYTGAATIGYASNAINQFDVITEDLTCSFVAYTMYFFLLAGFFWLNVMCYDIYSAFRKMKSMPRSQSKKRYVMIGHSCYAWGCPLVMTVFAYFVDMIGPSWLIRPRLAVSSCWFGETASLYLYFYGPMMLLLAANIYFFAITIYKLYEVSKQTAVLKNSESNSNHEKERDRCYLYGKLFVVMGVSWVMEVVSERLGGSEYLWYLTDIFNICQGIGIFIIFVLKRRVLYMLNKKFLPSHMFISECETTKATSSSTATTSNNGNALNGAALNGNGRKQEAADNMYVEKGYDNPIPMTPISTRVDAQNGGTTNGDVSVPIDDTTVIQRY
ncbi:probable G-protein coupled receptor Mth-like 3 isoform X1 [Nilaparvata lugens]|uniref:probable G-protein coupled receptor Mth-like 3 isoform X1 n=1 Tax=Nilaparvata lugens TaxID=108931 RepID=UPI00193D87FE|nr:probable G-protein coupled receptor Mth-like 3 isoform X1 [Nilaparvata lugens]